jgi:hypothetical protein
MTVLIYVNTSEQVGDPEHLKVFANADAAETWFEENDPEGVAFEYEVSMAACGREVSRVLLQMTVKFAVELCCVSYIVAVDAVGLLVHLQEHQYESRAGSDFAGVAFTCFEGMIAQHPKLSALEHSNSSRRNAC